MLTTNYNECSDSLQSEPESKAKSLISFLTELSCHPFFHLLILGAIVAICFGRTLGSYFLADDIGEIRYVHQIFNGNQNLFWLNFTGNYMQIPSMNVYRPTLLLTLVLDYLAWHGNAFGYYLSNLLYFWADSALLYFIVKNLSKSWSPWRSGLTALFSSALFAASPLHCESISWIVGRVDSACCFFYLSSILLFLKARENDKLWLKIAATICFWLSITTKEMAIGLPLILSAIAILFPARAHTKETNWQSLLKESWQFSKPIWLSVVLYFVIRYACLGTILGGYTGSIGATQSANALSRWLDIDTVHRLIFPFAQEIFGNTSIYSNLLFTCYVAVAGIVCFRLLAGSVPVSWLCFLSIWSLTAIAPIYRLWGIGYDLEGARFCFFLTLAGSCLLPILILAPDQKNKLAGLSNKLCLLGSVFLIAIICIFARTAQLTNILWVHAGKEVNAICRAAEALSNSSTNKAKLILLGIPKEHGGAHMIYNGDTLKMLLSQPFTTQASWEKFLTFDPILFGPSNYINATRFKHCLVEANTTGPYIWDSLTKNFVHVPLRPANSKQLPQITLNKYEQNPACLPHTLDHASYEFTKNGLTIHQSKPGDGLRIAPLSIQPLACDYVLLEIESSKLGTAPLSCGLSWKANKKYKHLADLQTGEYAQSDYLLETTKDKNSPQKKYNIYIPVSKYWKWFAQEEISELIITMPEINEITVKNIQLLKTNSICPTFTISGCNESGIGTYSIRPSTRVTCDASNIPAAKSIELEVSKTNFFFENFSASNEIEAVSRRLRISANSGDLHLSPSDFPNDPGFSQLRCRALDENGSALGPFSDTITISHK